MRTSRLDDKKVLEDWFTFKNEWFLWKRYLLYSHSFLQQLVAIMMC